MDELFHVFIAFLTVLFVVIGAAIGCCLVVEFIKLFKRIGAMTVYLCKLGRDWIRRNI